MASIDGPGRSRGAAPTSDLDQARQSEAAERKGKRPFAALQNRRGSVEKAARVREQQAGAKGKIDSDFRAKTDGILRSMKAKKGVAEQTTTRQAATPAQAKPPHTPKQAAPQTQTPTPQKPPRTLLRATPQATTPQAAAPPKPPRSEVSRSTATLGRTGPLKPDRSDASKTSATMPRPQVKPRTIFGAAAQAKAQPTPATRTIFTQQGQAQTGATKATAQGNYDVLTKVAPEEQRGIRYPTTQRGGTAEGTTERAAPRLRQRPVEGDKFLQGGGFNPSKTLNNPQAGKTLRGLEASVRTPAPPRLSVATRMANFFKTLFRVGTPVPTPAALSQQGNLYARLTEERLEDMLIRKPELSADKQRKFEAAEREINRNLRSITRNVADGDFTSQAKTNIGNAMQRAEDMFVGYETLEEAQGRQGDDA